MSEIVVAIQNLANKDWFDIIVAITPIILTAVIILQSFFHHKENKKIQERILRQEKRIKNQENILKIYGTFYDFLTILYNDNVLYEISRANSSYLFTKLYEIRIFQETISIRLDLAKLLFNKNNEKLYNIIEERYKYAIDIINKIMEYYNSGDMLKAANDAVEKTDVKNPIFKNYNYFIQDPDLNERLIKLCRTEKYIEIEKMVEEYIHKHSYELFDKYFEEYISLD